MIKNNIENGYKSKVCFNLDSNTEAGIQLTDKFPKDITLFDPSKIVRGQPSVQSALGDRVFGRKSVGDLVPSGNRRDTLPSFCDLTI